MKIHKYDTVIVGAGGAGMRAAIESTKRSRTAVLTKLYPTRSHTGAAQGGMAAALANVEEDNWEWHTFDTVKGGDYLVDQDAAEILAKEAIDAVLDLEKMGLPFNRTPNGTIDQRRFGGHSRNHGEAPVRRSCYAADRTGHMILQTLYQNCVKEGVEFFNEFYVLDQLITEVDGVKKSAGVVAYELATGEIHVFQAKAVIYASGGTGKFFKVTSNAHTLTGDGQAACYRRGLPLEDMEFFQFHPTGIWRMGILLTEGARGEGGILRNKDGERFMEKYAPVMKDLASRDVVSRSIYTEIREGRGCGPEGDHVYLDLTHLPPEQLDAKLPDITEFARTYLGIEPYTDPIPIQPTAHYAMGGIPTNVEGEVLADNTTVVPGLYAAGEVACVSVHGANRLGTNSLLDINVFGKRAGHRRRRVLREERLRRASREPGARWSRRRSSGCATPRARSGSPTSAGAAGDAWTRTSWCSAPSRRSRPRSRRSASCASATRTCPSRTRASGSTRTCWRPSSWATCSTWPRSWPSPRWPARSPAAVTTARTTRTATTSTSCATPWRTARSATTAPSPIRLDYKPVVQTRYQPMERKY